MDAENKAAWRLLFEKVDQMEKDKAMKADADKQDLRIVELRAENFMRLSAIRIRPDGTMVEITGKNDAGKTSAISAIAWAIGGKEFAERMPLRNGQEHGSVTVDLGALRVTKHMTRVDLDDPKKIETHLTVEFANGTKPSKPQYVLDELRGHLMDPVAFIKAKGAERIEMVKALFPEFDFAKNEKARKDAYDKRTDVNRDLKRALAARDAIVLPKGEKPARVVIADANEKLLEANRANDQLRQRAQRREVTADMAERRRDEAEKLRATARELEAEADRLDQQLAEADPLPPIVDTAPLVASIGDAERINGIVNLFENHERQHNEAVRLEQVSAGLTHEINNLDQAKVLAVSGAKLPFKGLAFGEDDVMLDDVPFEQAAFSMRLRASAAIAMALEPQLHVMLIREYGSLLDKDSMKLLAGIAEEHGWQVWIETVGEGGPGKVLIEDGRVIA